MKYLVVCLLAFFTSLQNISAQKKADAALENLYNNYPQEKAVLSFSKEEYVAGETIFFKAYVLSGYDLSNISTNLYIELFDKNKNIVDKQIVLLLSGIGEGSFQLPAYLAEDVYYIRAYTKWMQNFPENFFYIKSIPIYNPYSSQKLSQKSVQWTAEAYPESGNLLNGVLNRIAVKLHSESMLPTSVKGDLFEKGTNKLVAPVKFFNSQIGSVEFIPAEGKDYILKIEDDKGTTKETLLTGNTSTGLILKTRNAGDKIIYQLISKNLTIPEGYHIIGTLYDQMVYNASIKKTTGIIESSIDIKGFPAGVLQLTVLDQNENVIATRLTFIERRDEEIYAPQIIFEKLNLNPKSQNVWHIPLDTLNWFSYAIQVQDANHPQPNNFLADLYLTSDFTSNIENPGWYFDNVNEEKIAALDALLITQKWQRFNWKDLIGNKFPVINFLPEQYLSFKGTVTRGKKVETLQPVNLIFRTKDSTNYLSQAVTDSFGRFYITNMMFVDTVKVLYQLNNKKANARDIKIDFQLMNEFYPGKPIIPFHKYELQPRKSNDVLPDHIVRASETLKSALIADAKYKMMDEVTIRYNKKDATAALDEKLSSGLFRTGNATIIDFVNEEQTSALGYNNILDWLQGRVAGFSVMQQDGVTIPLIRNNQATIFINEFQADPMQLLGLSASDIAMIKIIKNNFMGSSGNNAAIAIYTRTGDMSSSRYLTQLPSNRLPGYRKQIQFLSPDYTNTIYNDIPDTRDILYRQQTLIPDTNNRGTIRFYNNAVTQNFRFLLTGYTSTGKPVYINKIISTEIKKE